MYKIKKQDLLINVFPNISELYQFIKSTPKRSTARDRSHDLGEIDFFGTESFEEAVNLLLGGDEKLYKKIQKEKNDVDITKILGNKLNKNQSFMDVVGYQADVPSYLKGIPTNMINKKVTKLSQKVINLFVDGSVPWHISTEDILKAGILYATIIDLLEKQGYRCNLYLTDASKYCGEKFIQCVRVKTDREPFNLKKMAFTLAHPSYFRRIGFAWIERCDIEEEPTASGYGSPFSDEEELKKLLEKELNMNIILFKVSKDYKVNIQDIIERLKDKGINLKGD